MPRSGISYNAELDIALAAQWWGHNSLETFVALPEYEQAYLVAVYRAQNKISGLLSFDQAEKARLANGRKGRK